MSTDNKKRKLTNTNMSLNEKVNTSNDIQTSFCDVDSCINLQNIEFKVSFFNI